MLSAVMETNDGFHGACYGLAAMYFLMLVWCLWKLAIFSSISRTWTGQKTIHACTAGAAGARAVFFLLLPRYGGVFFLVQITSDEAPLWLTALDELPSLFTLLVLGVLAQTWARSYYLFRRSEDIYRWRVLPVFFALYAVVSASQIALWGCYAASIGTAAVLPVLEGALYSLAFFGAAAAVCVFGLRAASIVLAVPVMGLSSRTLLSRSILAQSLFCAVAFSLRALTSLGAAIVAGKQIDEPFSEESIAGIAVTVGLFLVLDYVPMAVILMQNRRALGKSCCPDPSFLVRSAAALLCAPCAICRRLCAAAAEARRAASAASRAASASPASRLLRDGGFRSDDHLTFCSYGSAALPMRPMSSPPIDVADASAAAATDDAAAPLSPSLDASSLYLARGDDASGSFARALSASGGEDSATSPLIIARGKEGEGSAEAASAAHSASASSSTGGED